MEWIETTAKSKDEAIEKVLYLLCVDATDAEIEVIDEGKTGLFGRVKTEARVRARIKPKAPPPKDERRSRRSRGSDRSRSGGRSDSKSRNSRRRQSGGGQNKSQKSGRNDNQRSDNRGGDNRGGDSRGGGKQRSDNRGGDNRGGDNRGGGNQRSDNRGGDNRGGDNRGGDSQRGNNRGGGSSQGSDSRGGGDSSNRSGRNRGRGGSNKGKAAAATGAAAAAGAVAATRNDNKKADRAMNDDDFPISEQSAALNDFVTGVAEIVDSSATVVVEDTEDALIARVEGEDLGLLVGHGGSTLTAFEELARTAMQRAAAGRRYRRIRVDVDGYRERRREALSAFAVQVAEQVRDSGETKALEPMGSADRKTVHDAISDVVGVETTSEGSDPRRYVVVISTDSEE